MLVADHDDAYSAARALYWYCSGYYDGQWDDLYRIMCTLGYVPTRSERAPSPEDEDETDYQWYQALVNKEIDPHQLNEQIEAVYSDDR